MNQEISLPARTSAASGPPVFMDIETTGLLNKPDARLTLAGFLDNLGVHQFFVEEPAREPECLEFIQKSMAAYNIEKSPVVTYNGIYFDFPFIKNRTKALEHCLNLPESLDNCAHIDLHPIAAKNINGSRFISKSYAFSTLSTQRLYNSSGLRSGLIQSLPKNLRFPTEDYELMYHNALDLYQTAVLYEKFKRFGWL